jgi:hypothetical protein
MKSPLRPAGIELATFRFVAQHLNHCATAAPAQLGTVTLFKVKVQNRTETSHDNWPSCGGRSIHPDFLNFRN